MARDDADATAEYADADYADTELLYNQSMEPALTAAVGEVGLRAGWRALDAGCGPGGVLPLLHAAVAPGGSVLGLDLSAPHVARARTLVERLGLRDAVAVATADLRAALPVADGSFDAVWSADVLYPDTVGDPAAAVARLRRALRPGGRLAVFYGNWLRPLYLPGYARLEHLIGAAREALYARDAAWQGAPHPERAPGWLQRAGLTACRVLPLPLLHRQPLPAAVRRYIEVAIFGHHYRRAVAEGARLVGMSDADVALWATLADPAHPDYLLDRPDYYCTLTPLLAVGENPA
jgi:SAM-dependent methyltransferase